MISLLLITLLGQAQGGSPLTTRLHCRQVQTGRSKTCGTPQSLFVLTQAPTLAQQCTGASITSNGGVVGTFARASGATCEKADGTLVALTSNQPRLEAQGYLTEAPSTNLALQSEDVSTSWTNVGATYTLNVQSFGFVGQNTMDQIATSSGGNGATQAIGVPSGVGPFIGSAYISVPSGTGPASLGVQCATGVPTTCTCVKHDGTACSASISSSTCTANSTFTTTPVRMETVVICSLATLSVNMNLIPGTLPSTAGTAIYGGMMLENQTGTSSVAPHMSSYIATTTASASRAQDVLSFPAPVTNAQGCGGASFQAKFPTTNARILSTDNGGEWTPLALGVSTSTGIVAWDGTNNPTLAVSDVVANNQYAYTSWQTGALSLNSNGTANTTAYSGNMLNTLVYVGGAIAGFTDPFNGWVSNIKYSTSVNGCR